MSVSRNTDHYEDLSQPCVVAHCHRAADYTLYVCADCHLRASEQLAGIRDMWAELDSAAPYGAGDGQPQARGKRRPAPGRLDVMAARDRRTVAHVVGPDDVDGDVKSIPGTLLALDAWLNEEFGWNGVDPFDVPTWVQSILLSLTLAAGKPWFDELAADVAELHAQCERLTGRTADKSLAPCPLCEGQLNYEGNGGSVLAVQCRDCRTRYEGLELIELGQQRATAA